MAAKKIDFDKLREPFNPWEVEWRVGTVSSKNSCTLLCYLTSRAVMDRYDRVVGPENWTDRYEAGPGGGILCTTSILVNGVWIAKQDAAENTNIEAVKGGISSAFKRCAVKWGIGRYLYDLDSPWIKIMGGPNAWANGQGIDISSKGRHVGWVRTPMLPSWALPGGQGEPDSDDRAKPPEDPVAAEELPHHDSFDDAERAWFFGSLPEGLKYDRVKEWLTEKGETKPSTWDHERRQRFLTALFLGKCKGLYEGPPQNEQGVGDYEEPPEDRYDRD